nr:hypothetical protein [Myxococcota bacterium]
AFDRGPEADSASSAPAAVPASPMRPGAVAAPTATAEDAMVVEDSRPAGVPLEQLAKQAESAARRGDCAAVRLAVTRIRKQDEAFYQGRLQRNAAVTRCL